MQKTTTFCVGALLLVASIGLAEAYILHDAKVPQDPWQLSKVQPVVNLQEKLSMSIGLHRKNIDQLERILLEVSNPSAAIYGEHLNNEQMRRLVSPGTDAVEAVQNWLSRHGISSVTVATHEDSMTFEATRSQISSLLNVKWAQYENPVSQQTSIRALGRTEIPSHLQNVVQVVAGHRGWPIPPKKINADMVAASTKIVPSVIYRAYNESVSDVPSTPSGKKNIQSFFQAQGQYVKQSDLSTFCSTYMPQHHGGTCNISKYIGGINGKKAGVESSLDSEYIIATSLGAETWVYTYSGVDFCSDLLTWSQDVFQEREAHPYVISMSYGSQHLPTYCEGSGANRLSEDTMKMGAMGISVMIASGDEGSGQFSRGGWNWGYLSPSFPAELPYVTSVGSTTFINGNSGPERAASFSGGGFSWSWDAPKYQRAAIKSFLTSTPKTPKGKFNATGRGTPDVSFLGEAFTVISNGWTMQVGGTSSSTPSFAGMVTLLNNERLKSNKTLGFLNPLLYANADCFTDITTGSNDKLHDDEGWYAQAGWDPATGLGTPRFDKLVEMVRALNRAEKRL